MPTSNPPNANSFHLAPGYSLFTPDAGKHKVMLCKVCASICHVERDLQGPRSYAGNLALHHGQRKREDFPRFDRFECPHVAKPWHREAQKLAKERDQLHSPSLRALVENELNTLVARHLSPNSRP